MKGTPDRLEACDAKAILDTLSVVQPKWRMADHLIIERLEFPGHCGVTETERQVAQPIGVDIELEFPPGALAEAVEADRLDRTVDYAQVAERVIEIGRGQEWRLLETLAERLSDALLAEWPVSRARLWVRKLVPPVSGVKGSVGVRVDRIPASRRVHRGPPHHEAGPAGSLSGGLEPAGFLIDQFPRLPKGAVLDIAAGRGRNALYLAAHGYTVEAIDRDEQALAELSAAARQRNLPNLTVRGVDLEANTDRPPDLGKERYDVILVFFYLHRPLFPALREALKPGGVLVSETFLIDNHLRHQHPRRREFCLAHNELLDLISGLRVLHYDEGEHEGDPAGAPAYTARLVAKRNG